MHNLLILGTGRSGTSMVAGMFRHSGHFQGDWFALPREANKYGFFEDKTVNAINNVILSRALLTGWLKKLPRPLRPGVYGDSRALWLAAPRRLVPRILPQSIVEKIKERVSHRPFCFKDPRFSTTLPFWRPFLPEATRFVVVFRHPQLTVHSMLREAAEGYRPPIRLSAACAYSCWFQMYSAILDRHSREGAWLFLNYRDVVNRAAVESLSVFTDSALDVSELDPTASRSRRDAADEDAVPGRCRELFAALEARAASDLEHWAMAGAAKGA